jgi:phosphatidate cytidylyltransferase
MEKNNLIKRFISGISLATVLLISIFVYRPLFYILACILPVLMLIEWHNMTKSKKSFLYNIIGQILIITPITSILIISYLDTEGWLLLTLFVCISTVDVMAMFGGKLIGGKKLAPIISPNKTISGLLVGTCSACIFVNCLTLLSHYKLPMELHKNNLLLTLCIFVLGLTAQLSDLLISCFKRKFNIKDTGNIIPGHGGVLDRFDSIILTAPLVLILYLASNF